MLFNYNQSFIVLITVSWLVVFIFFILWLSWCRVTWFCKHWNSVKYVTFCLDFFSFSDFWAWKSQLSQPVADLVLRNGVIYTSDDSLPFADSMAVANGRVLCVGNRSFVQVILVVLLNSLPHLVNKQKKEEQFYWTLIFMHGQWIFFILLTN